MPAYDFKCKKCNKIRQDVVLPITHLSAERPMCCDDMMNYYITTPPSVVWKDPTIGAFRPIATKNAPIINNMKEHREYLKRNDFVDANDHFAPPTAKEQRLAREEAQESISAITPTTEQNQQLKESGLDSILNDT